MNAAVEHYLDSGQELALPGQGTPWLDSLRYRGRLRFGEVGFPTLQDENWRSTNLRSMLRQVFSPVHGRSEEPTPELPGEFLTGLDSQRLVFLNGRYSEGLSDVEHCPDGLTVVSLASALASEMAGIDATLGSCVPENCNGFTALNTAFIEDGVYLQVEDGFHIDQPVEIVFLSTAHDGQMVQPRNLYVIGKSSRIKLIEHYVSIGENSYFTNSVSELIARDSAIVEHTRLQEEGSKAFHIGGVFMHLHQNSTAVSNNVALGAALARTDVLANFKATGGKCDLNGVYVVNGRQHVDNFTQVDHEQPDCCSDEFYKGVLDNRARAVFRGRVVVHKDAQHTDAQQQNRNLLLSEDSEIDTKPQLEIYADDVKCSHGATVGQLDEDALFYLRSRAIDETTARSFLTYAFAADVLNRFSLKPIRDYVEASLSRKLFGVDHLEELV